MFVLEAQKPLRLLAHPIFVSALLWMEENAVFFSLSQSTHRRAHKQTPAQICLCRNVCMCKCVCENRIYFIDLIIIICVLY